MNNTEQLPPLFSFIEQSPTPFHATALIRQRLLDHDFTELPEGARWNLNKGNNYFVTRNGSVIAFTLGVQTCRSSGFRIIAAHTDSPCLQIKPRRRADQSPYLVAGVEKYGGAILHTWFDRELSLAGRVCCISKSGDTCCLLVDFKKPLAYIPSLAIHLDREVNAGQAINIQTDLSPILGLTGVDTSACFDTMLCDQIAFQYPGFSIDQIMGFDLFCYDPAPPLTFGLNSEFIAAPRLDNLLSCHIGLDALFQCSEQVNGMLLFTNHEEVGSTSYSGAQSSFPGTILNRIFGSQEDMATGLHHSFLLSLDNAHATHPNYRDKSDNDHPVLLNHGPVIKINASQRYTTTAGSGSLFRLLATEKGIKTQDFVMRSDMACGSTIGPLASAQLGIMGVDVGVPTWGMHSVREVTGSSDPSLLSQVVCHYLKRKVLPPFPPGP